MTLVLVIPERLRSYHGRIVGVGEVGLHYVFYIYMSIVQQLS